MSDSKDDDQKQQPQPKRSNPEPDKRQPNREIKTPKIDYSTAYKVIITNQDDAKD